MAIKNMKKKTIKKARLRHPATSTMKECELFIKATLLYLEQDGLRFSNADRDPYDDAPDYDPEVNTYGCAQRGESRWDDSICQYELAGMRNADNVWVNCRREYRRNSKFMLDRIYGVSCKKDGKPFGYVGSKRYTSERNFAKALSEYYAEHLELAIERDAIEASAKKNRAMWEAVYPSALEGKEEDDETLEQRVTMNGWGSRDDETVQVSITGITPEDFMKLREMFPAKPLDQEVEPIKKRRRANRRRKVKAYRGCGHAS